MTTLSTSGIDAAFAAALDRFDVPSPSSYFLDRVGQMPAADAPALPPAPRRRLFEAGRRGAWARRPMIALIALSIASATAATTAYFPVLKTITIPRITAMLSPVATARPKLARAHAHKPAAVQADAALAAASVDPLPTGQGTGLVPELPPALKARIRQQIRREQQVEAIQQRLAARGVDLPKPIIRRRLIRRQVVRNAALAMAARGDTTPLPPQLETMRQRADVFLANHPKFAERLRRQIAARDVGLLPDAVTANAAALAATPPAIAASPGLARVETPDLAPLPEQVEHPQSSPPRRLPRQQQREAMLSSSPLTP